jgi:polyhydroxybutyrate depolymerase
MHGTRPTWLLHLSFVVAPCAACFDTAASSDAATGPQSGAAAATPPPVLPAGDAGLGPFDAGAPADGGPAASTDAGAPTDGGLRPPDAGQPALPSCRGSVLKPGTSSFTLMRDGTSRTVNVYVPKSYDGKTALPLVVDFHGLHEGAALHESVSNWDDTVDTNGYVVAMPQGLQNSWNVGPCCTESRSVDDVGFARALVERIAADGCIDTRRIYATGYSNGGGMSFAIACEAADLFAAVAPAAFDLLEEQSCAPRRPISVFAFRGTNDPVVPYAGGASTPPTLYTLPELHFLGAAGTFARWAMLNGCSGTPSDSGGGCNTYGSCAGGVKVTLCTTQGGGHDPSDAARAWPMLRDYVLP